MHDARAPCAARQAGERQNQHSPRHFCSHQQEQQEQEQQQQQQEQQEQQEQEQQQQSRRQRLQSGSSISSTAAAAVHSSSRQQQPHEDDFNRETPRVKSQADRKSKSELDNTYVRFCPLVDLRA